MKIGAIFILLCSLAYAADEKTSAIPESVNTVMDGDLPNGRGHIHAETFYRGNTRIMQFHQKTVAGQTKTGRIFILGDVTVYETEDDGDGRLRSVILCNDKTKQVEGFIVKRDGTAVPFDARQCHLMQRHSPQQRSKSTQWPIFGARLLGRALLSLKPLRRYKKRLGTLAKRRKRKTRDEATRRA